jgi:hypothetical protein
MRRREVWTSDSPLWLWAALAALLLVAAVAGAVAAVALARDDREAAPKSSVPLVTTGPGTTDTVGIITQPTITIVPPTSTFGTTSTLSTTTTFSTTTLNTTTSSGTITWPSGRNGYTIVLKSVPKSEGRSQADAAAQRARSNGLTQVGVLDSSQYSSLNPGYWVTFTGVYDTQMQAQSGLSNARTKGFPTAYVRAIRD